MRYLVCAHAPEVVVNVGPTTPIVYSKNKHVWFISGPGQGQTIPFPTAGAV